MRAVGTFVVISALAITTIFQQTALAVEVGQPGVTQAYGVISPYNFTANDAVFDDDIDTFEKPTEEQPLANPENFKPLLVNETEATLFFLCSTCIASVARHQNEFNILLGETLDQLELLQGYYNDIVRVFPDEWTTASILQKYLDEPNPVTENPPVIPFCEEPCLPLVEELREEIEIQRDILDNQLDYNRFVEEFYCD